MFASETVEYIPFVDYLAKSYIVQALFKIKIDNKKST